jgi:hypothetical protein
LANVLARDITRVLSDALGDFIASATVKKNCELIGTIPDDLTAEQLPALSTGIEKSVTFFSDSSTAKTIGEKVRAMKA